MGQRNKTDELTTGNKEITDMFYSFNIRQNTQSIYIQLQNHDVLITTCPSINFDIIGKHANLYFIPLSGL